MTAASDARERVALACRILHMEGHDHFVLGHVSVRDGSDGMWVKSFGRGLDETEADDVVRCDLLGRQPAGERLALPNEVHLHAGIYRARPDVGAVVHTHPAMTAAFAATDAPFRLVGQDSLWFVGGVGRYPRASLVTTPAEGDALAEALGTGRVVVLRAHGLATADASIEQAVFLALSFERSLRTQLLAERYGEVRGIEPEEASRMAEAFEPGYRARAEGIWDHLVRRLERLGLDPGAREPDR